MGKMVDSKERQKKEVISSMITIHHDDCLNAMKQLPDDHVDFVFADLPYGTTNNKWDVVLDLDALWDEYERVVKTNGAIVLSASQPFTSQLVMSKPEWFKYEWIWEKQRASNFMRAKHEPLKYHENIFDNPSNRLQIYFQLMKLFSEEYVQHRTPKMLEALEDLRRQGIDVEIKGDSNGNHSE